jgi:hypothetical protein
MNQHSQPDDNWSPATSEPGELYTVEGRIRSVGAFAQGLVNPNPRGKRYRSDMQRTGLWVALGAIVLVAVVATASALLGH